MTDVNIIKSNNILTMYFLNINVVFTALSNNHARKMLWKDR